MLAHGFLRHGELIRVAPRPLVIGCRAIDTFVSHIPRITRVQGPVFTADTQPHYRLAGMPWAWLPIPAAGWPPNVSPSLFTKRAALSPTSSPP